MRSPPRTPARSGKPGASPRLLADIGGTNARFALQRGRQLPVDIVALEAVDFPDLATAVTAYLDRVRPELPPKEAVFAVACPVAGDDVRLTNSPWTFSIAGLRQRLGLASLVVVNDFAALALSIPHLPADAIEAVGAGQPVANAPIAVIGPGTGLGVSGLVPVNGSWQALASEGGHVTLAPGTDEESEIIALARRRFGHVSAERLISGPGLVILCRILAQLRPDLPAAVATDALRPEDVTSRAMEGSCAICSAALALFCGLLGEVAGDLALTLGARGGVYIGGGIVPSLGPAFAASGFRRRFEEKGRFAGYLSAIPTYVVRHHAPALVGLAAMPGEAAD